MWLHRPVATSSDAVASSGSGNDSSGNGALEDEETTPCARGAVWETLVSNAQCLQVDVVEVYGADVRSPWDDACGGGVRAELERLHAWLTE